MFGPLTMRMLPKCKPYGAIKSMRRFDIENMDDNQIELRLTHSKRR